MKLIRWLLSNIILIALVLVLSYLYVYWDNLTGKDTPAGKTFAWLSDEFEAVEGLLGYLKVSGNPSDESSDSDADERVATVTEEASAPEIAEPAADLSASMQPAPTDRFVTPEIEESLSRLNSDGTVSSPLRAGQAPIGVAGDSAAPAGGEAQPQTTRELWISARKDFHRRDFEGSISSYEQLISKTQDNFDAYGELGNVYFNQGKMKEAADSYYEAAVILVRLGQVERASSLMGMLGRMDPVKAKELQDLILSARL